MEKQTKYSLFLDSNNSIQIVTISIIINEMINIHSYNINGEDTGYMNVFFHPNKRIFLETIYCFHKYRSLNIASKLSKIMDYLLQDYKGYLIRGSYEPSQLSSDRRNNIFCSKEELDERAKRFYKANGYQIVLYDKYKNNPSMYPELSVIDDFQLGEELCNCIVKKTVAQAEKFVLLNQILIGEDDVNQIAKYLTDNVKNKCYVFKR